MIIKAAKRIFNSDKICRSYCDFYFGVTFLEHAVYGICLCLCVFKTLENEKFIAYKKFIESGK